MQIHKRNQHSKCLGNLLVNRAYKRVAYEATLTNRAARRAPKRAAYAEEQRMRAEVAALVVMPQAEADEVTRAALAP